MNTGRAKAQATDCGHLAVNPITCSEMPLFNFQKSNDPTAREHIFSGLCLFALSLLIGTAILNNAIWIHQYPGDFSGMDEEHHLLRGLLVHDALWGIDATGVFNPDIYWPTRWPPLVYLTSAITMQLFGRSQPVMTMTISIFLAALLLFTYGIGSRLKSPAAGLAAAALLAYWPFLLRYSRYYTLDLTLAACCAAAVYFLMASENFKKPWACVGFGLSLGLGLLAKIVFPMIVAPPLLALLIINRKEITRRAWVHLLMSLLIALSISAFWYGPRMGEIFNEFYYHISDYYPAHQPFEAEQGGFFLWQTKNELGTVCWLFLIAALLHGFAWKKLKQEQLLPIYLWLLIPLLLFAVAPSNISRLAMACLPAAVLVVVLFLWKSPKAWRLTAIPILAVFFVINLQALTAWPFPYEVEAAAKTQNTTPPVLELGQFVDRVGKEFSAGTPVNICFFQAADYQPKLGAEQMWFAFKLKYPPVRFHGYDRFTSPYSGFRRYVACLKQPGVSIFWTDQPDQVWPDERAVRRVVDLAPLHAPQPGPGLMRAGFPLNYNFFDFPASPPPSAAMIFKGSIATPPAWKMTPQYIYVYRN